VVVSGSNFLVADRLWLMFLKLPACDQLHVYLVGVHSVEGDGPMAWLAL
jgi:hypothetical protein